MSAWPAVQRQRQRQRQLASEPVSQQPVGDPVQAQRTRVQDPRHLHPLVIRARVRLNLRAHSQTSPPLRPSIVLHCPSERS